MNSSGISPSFLGLSQSSGQITHVLLTRSRLCPRASPGSSHHLHVLSTPPAFLLRQDQTLRESDSLLPYFSESLSCLHGRRVHKYDGRYDEVNQTIRRAGAPNGSGCTCIDALGALGARRSAFTHPQ